MVLALFPDASHLNMDCCDLSLAFVFLLSLEPLIPPFLHQHHSVEAKNITWQGQKMWYNLVLQWDAPGSAVGTNLVCPDRGFS